MRPDKTKAVLSVDKKEKRLQVNVDPDRPDAWRIGLTGHYLNLVRQNGVDVMIVVGLKRNLRKMYQDETISPS